MASNENSKIEVTHIMVEKTMAIPEPPPPSFSCSDSLTIQEWFFKLCDKEKSEKDSIAYIFALYETENCYAIYLSVLKEREKDDKAGTTNNDDDPSDEYYPLSKNDYKVLKWDQVINKIKSQIKEFSKTEKFKNSSLAKAKAITMSFDDGDLVRIK